MKRKLTAILLVLILAFAVFTVTACNKDDNTDDGTQNGDTTGGNTNNGGDNAGNGDNGNNGGDNICNHIEVIDAAVAPTCTETGLTEGKHCSVCNEVLAAQTVVDALGHTEVIDSAVAPTCTQTGLTEGKHCSACNTVLVAQTEVEALGHTEVTDSAVAPTCTQTGLTEGKHCSACNTVLVKQEAAPMAHSWNSENLCAFCGEMKPSDGLEYVVYNGNCHISGIGSCTDTEIVLPSLYNGLPVIAIKEGTFKDRTGLTSVIIPSSIKNIYAEAFSGCTSLSEISLSEGITSISHNAFYNCSALTELVIPDSVTTIGDSAFLGCIELRSITLGKGLTSLGDNAFDGCRKVSELNYNPVAMRAFGINSKHFSRLGESAGGLTLTIGKDVKKLPDYIFYNEKNASLPNYVYIKNVIFEAGSVCESIGIAAFYNSFTLTAINIPNSVTSIGRGAFRECTNLASVTLGNGVTVIGEHSFEACESLESIIIPDSVTAIGTSAFDKCTALQYNSYDNANYLGNENNLYLWLVSAKDKSITSCNIHDDTKYIADHAFYGCSFTSIEIPNGVNSIGISAFQSCKSLSSVNIASSVVSIGEYAFGYCDSLVSIVIPNGVKSIGHRAFGFCSGLKSVTIAESVTSIGDHAFIECGALESAVFESFEGWYVTRTENAASGMDVVLTDAATAAKLLCNDYAGRYWYKK